LSHQTIQLVSSAREPIQLPGGIVLEPYTHRNDSGQVVSGYWVRLDGNVEARLSFTADGFTFGHPGTTMFDAQVPGDLEAICQRIAESAAPAAQRVALLRQQARLANEALAAAQQSQRIELSNAICIEEEGP
jgi:hypothetical protein